MISRGVTRVLTTAQRAHLPTSSVLSRSVSTFSSSSSLSRSPASRSVAYPLLAAGISLLAAQQLHFHSSSTLPASPAAAPVPASPSSSPASAPAKPAPSFDLTVLPYYSKAAFLSQATVKLYQYQTCPFCNKVRAYLDFAHIPYEIIEVNPMTKAQIKPFNLHSVPVLTVDQLVLHDSSSIITAFSDLFAHYDRKAHTFSRSSPGESQWRDWVDQTLIFLTAPNLYTSLSSSLASMDYIMSQTSLSLPQRLLNKYIGGPAMYYVTEFKLKKKRNITNPRAQLFDALKTFMQEGVKERPFRGGDQPDLSDVAVFGVVRAMMPFEVGAELRDPSNVSPAFVDWYRRMDGWIKSSAKSSVSAADYKAAGA